MKRISIFTLFFLLVCNTVFYSQVPERKGWWKFDNADTPLKAETGYGNDLVLVGKHEFVDGPDVTNNAVAIGVGSYYKVFHGIMPNGGGTKVNEYTIEFDFRMPVLSGWHCFFQISPLNDTDGDCFINTSGHIGVGSTGYSDHIITAGEWYKLIISVKNGEHYKYYLDGQLFREGTVQTVDGRFGLDSLILAFADDDGEDGDLDCAELAIWDRALTSEEVFAIGSFHEIDTTSPNSPSGLSTVPGTYQNLILWTDVSGEEGEVYDIYYSEEPITDLTKAEVLKFGVAENTGNVEQILRSAITDQDLTYYYAVVCKDYAGNHSLPAYLNTPTINKGKGVPTIAKTAPVNFIADGDLTEWASVPQFRILRSEGTGFDAPSGLHDGDADYSVIAYLAVDNDNLYFAADVTDDIYSWIKRGDPWMNDAINFYIGLFDSHTTNFSVYKHGATPHYEIRFDEEKATIGYSESLLFPGANYFFGQKALTPGYYIEAKIPFIDLAQKRDSGYTSTKDSVFHPVEGMKIPIDFSCNDADASGDRELIFCYSPYNEDQSWNNPSRWLWTWIGNKMKVDPNEVEDGMVATDYRLEQNYPNPFNPSTKITYSLQNPELVSLKVFDVLGREAASLVNQYQTAGSHTVNFNAANLASGIYFYKLEAGSFQSIKKLILLK
ncbi:MAG: sugar-binding protein [Ignavibacteriaceae bacterium]|jgi:hypothetical protein